MVQAHAQRAALTMRRPVPPQHLDHVLILVRLFGRGLLRVEPVSKRDRAAPWSNLISCKPR